jgi:acid stress-induced BolA-like protein IbaG/YrbA
VFQANEIKLIVEKALEGAVVEVRDMTGTSDHFEITVISSAFEGKRAVERHRMVYSAIGKAVGNEIHALAVKTFTPAESKND